MINTKAKVLDHSDDSSRVLLDSLLTVTGCSACLSDCGARKKVTTRLPGTYSSTIELSLSLNDQIVLLLHSLVYPLLGFVLGGCLGEWIEAGDLVVFGAAMAGLLVGIKCCKPQTLERLKISEIEDERVNGER